MGGITIGLFLSCRGHGPPGPLWAGSTVLLKHLDLAGKRPAALLLPLLLSHAQAHSLYTCMPHTPAWPTGCVTVLAARTYQSHIWPRHRCDAADSRIWDSARATCAHPQSALWTLKLGLEPRRGFSPGAGFTQPPSIQDCLGNNFFHPGPAALGGLAGLFRWALGLG